MKRITNLALSILPMLAAGQLLANPTETFVPMPDGTGLRTMVLLPDQPGPHRAIVVRTPYSIPTPPPGAVDLDDEAGPDEINAAWQDVLDRGYAVVQQETRGRGGSGGIDMLFQADRQDGAALAAWIRSQPWSDGTFLLSGDSADGFAGYLMAGEQPEGLQAAFFQASCADLLQTGIVRKTGGLQMEVLAPWILQQAGESGPDNRAAMAARGVEPDVIEAVSSALFERLFDGDPTALMDRPLTTLEPVRTLQPEWSGFIGEAGYAERARYFDTAADLDAPITHVALWQDSFLDCTIESFLRVQERRGGQSLIVLNGTHYQIDDAATWRDAGLERAFLDWLDGVETAPVRIAVENGDPGPLIAMESWPPAEAERNTLFLATVGLIDAAAQSGVLGTLVTDATEPHTAEGGRNLVIPAGTQMADLPPNGSGRIVLLAEPLLQDTILVGAPRLHFVLAADAEDADVVARLVVIDRQGQARQILETLFRARYRNGRADPQPLARGEPIAASFDLGQTAHQLRAGERLGLILQGSNLPRWDIAAGTDEDPSIARAARRIETDILTDGTTRLEFLTMSGAPSYQN